ncbi:unnamed protein product [Haemonchus placei]|uniref:Uncharacterized protein n=1 Tax=Haemonchus placei TaxID=6290 RepID=A0A0N4VV05_HAEPC|nr:unnamed protein product [Haemonchus placei]
MTHTNMHEYTCEETAYAIDTSAVACSKKQSFSSLNFVVLPAMPSRLGQFDDAVIDIPCLHVPMQAFVR